MPDLSAAATPTLASPPIAASASPRFGAAPTNPIAFATLLSQLRDATGQATQDGPLVGEATWPPPGNPTPTEALPTAGEPLPQQIQANGPPSGEDEPGPSTVDADGDDPGDKEAPASTSLDGTSAAMTPMTDPSAPPPPVDPAPVPTNQIVPPNPPLSSATSLPMSSTARPDPRARSIPREPFGPEPSLEPDAAVTVPASMAERAARAQAQLSEAALSETDQGEAATQGPATGTSPAKGHAAGAKEGTDAVTPNAPSLAASSMPAVRPAQDASTGPDARPRASSGPTHPHQPDANDQGPTGAGAIPTTALAGTPGPDPVGHPRPTSPTPATQIAERLAPVLTHLEASGFGTQTLTVRLDPAELGRVEIRIEQAQDVPARVHILVDRPETLALLRQDQSRLEQALDRAGVGTRAREITLDLSPPDTIVAQAVAPDRGVASRPDDAFRASDNPSPRSDPGGDPGAEQRPRHGDGRPAGFGDTPARGFPNEPSDSWQDHRMTSPRSGDWRRLGLNITA